MRIKEFPNVDVVKIWSEGKEVHYCTKDDRHYKVMPDGRKYLVNHKEILNGAKHD